MTHVEELIKRLTSATLLLRVYPGEHPRVKQAVDEVAESLWMLTKDGETVSLLIYEGQFVHKGELLYDASIAGARLVEIIRKRGAHGIRLQPGTSRPEIQIALHALGTAADDQPLSLLMDRLRADGVTHIEIIEECGGEIGTPDRLKTALNDGLRGRIRVPQRAYEHCLGAMRDLMADLRAGRELVAARAEEAVSLVIDSAQLDPAVLRRLMQVANDQEFTFNHAVNCCVFAVQTASALTSDQVLIQEIGQAALLHDVGMFGLPDEIIFKTEPLTEEERKLVEEHPFRGAKALTEAPAIGPLAVQAAYLHHRHFDGGGYPEIRPATRIGFIPRLISAIDTYAALTTRRPFRRAAAPDVAMGILLEQAGTKLDPRAVATFVEAIGVYPIGTAVALDTGEIGVVAALTPGQPMRPQVRLLSDPAGGPLEEALVVSLEETDADGRPLRSIVRSADLEARLVPLAYPDGDPRGGALDAADLDALGAGLLRA
ncbi:MAG: HD domain-containing protein [Planctomycetes bacterium]|nr:HD domain-containing protein [Planctomycetota bacterium]